MWVCCVLYVVLYRALLHTVTFYWKISLIKQGKTSGYLPTVHVSPTVAVPVPVATCMRSYKEVHVKGTPNDMTQKSVTQEFLISDK